MKRITAELLLAFALWIPGMVAYSGSLTLPWFTLDHFMRKAPNLAHFDRAQAQITGLDAFDFLFLRLKGGSFVWLAHPLLWVGWLLLVCRRWVGASVAGCLALVAALNAPMLFQPRDGPWLSPGVGYYLWFASLALLATSVLLRNRFLRGYSVAETQTLGRLAVRQEKFAEELAELKQQVAALFDHQAVSFLEQIEAREPCGTDDG